MEFVVRFTMLIDRGQLYTVMVNFLSGVFFNFFFSLICKGPGCW
jgi:hypothetical protein